MCTYVCYECDSTCAFMYRCVIAELFMDGRPLFDLSQLLEYYSSGDKEFPEPVLKKIPDKLIRVSTRQLGKGRQNS